MRTSASATSAGALSGDFLIYYQIPKLKLIMVCAQCLRSHAISCFQQVYSDNNNILM